MINEVKEKAQEIIVAVNKLDEMLKQQHEPKVIREQLRHVEHLDAELGLFLDNLQRETRSELMKRNISQLGFPS